MKFIKNHWKKIVVVIIGLIFVWVIVRNRMSLDDKKDKTESTRIKRGDVEKTLTISGEIEAEEQVTLRFQTSGRLAWVGVKEGDVVKKYQTIATLDQRQLQKELQKYLNTYEKTRYDFEQTNQDYKDDLVTLDGAIRDKAERIFKKNQLDLNSSVLNVEIQNLIMEYSNLWSPIEGIVTKVDVPIAGTNITPAGAEFVIINPKMIYFSAQADQTEVIDMFVDMPGDLVLDAYPDEVIKGSIKTIAFTPTAGETGTVYQIKFFVPIDQNKIIKIGMTGDVTFTLRKQFNVLYAPSTYVKSDGKKKYLYVMRNNKKEKVYVKIGLEGDNRTEIVDGLAEGTIIYD